MSLSKYKRSSLKDKIEAEAEMMKEEQKVKEKKETKKVVKKSKKSKKSK